MKMVIFTTFRISYVTKRLYEIAWFQWQLLVFQWLVVESSADVPFQLCKTHRFEVAYACSVLLDSIYLKNNLSRDSTLDVYIFVGVIDVVGGCRSYWSCWY